MFLLQNNNMDDFLKCVCYDGIRNILIIYDNISLNEYKYIKECLCGLLDGVPLFEYDDDNPMLYGKTKHYKERIVGLNATPNDDEFSYVNISYKYFSSMTLYLIGGKMQIIKYHSRDRTSGDTLNKYANFNISYYLRTIKLNKLL